jgi:hypothetical protein
VALLALTLLLHYRANHNDDSYCCYTGHGTGCIGWRRTKLPDVGSLRRRFASG